ncbi:MAG: hypothetical protein WCR55_08930 [Lentisphaerota bacterium]
MNNTDMQFIITVMGNNKYIISQGIITVTAFIIGIGTGVIIQFYMSKLPVGRLFIIFVYIISFLASILYLLEVFGKLDYFFQLVHRIFS